MSRKPLTLLPLLLGSLVFAAQSEKADHFKKWLDEDVAYIITKEERAVFEKLTAPAEKEKFIEQFWLRRDPTPGTVENEFKEEHYRRIAYANQHFSSAWPGWRTDRGMVYIKFGPPDEIERHPSGGRYERPFYEGGGQTSTYPFEIWRYRYIEGMGQDIEIEFVDPTLSGEYRMALSPQEKDALLFTPGGLTLREQLGLSDKAERIKLMHLSNPSQSAIRHQRLKDMPFERLRQYAALQRPPEIRFKQLREVVTAKLSYDLLPFSARADFLPITEQDVLVPITVQVENKHLAFKALKGVYRAEVNLYGAVASATGRIMAEFEDTLGLSLRPEKLEEAKKESSVYQKLLTLSPGIYKLDLVLKDTVSGRIGNLQQRITAPRPPADALALSSLMLAARLEPTAGLPAESLERFVFGELKVIPKVRPEFTSGEALNLYLQIANVTADAALERAFLRVSYILARDGKSLKEIEERLVSAGGRLSGNRVVLAKKLALADLEPGPYNLRVEILDEVSGRRAAAESSFVLR